jgi:phosphoribosyl 1,2-cyclic phosphodiesterase
MLEHPLLVRFWGVRGSLPVAAPSTSVFGGNTSCVEMRCGNRLLVFDAGSGIARLGQAMAGEGGGRLDILFTHCHYDHIEGFPFFQPLHDERWSAHVWAGHTHGRLSAADMIAGYMRKPYFPVGPACFCADIAYRDFMPGDALDLGDGIAIRTIALDHPGGAVGYRVDYGGASACYITDVEHKPGRLDDDLVAFIEGTGVFIYDATYSDEEFAKWRGFGHSTWQQGARLAEAAGAGEYVAFHHLPEHNDAVLAERELHLKRLMPEARFAREGLSLVARQPKGHGP